MDSSLACLLQNTWISAEYPADTELTPSGKAAQEFSLLHNFTDVARLAAASLCWSRGKTRPSVTIFGEAERKSADLWFLIRYAKHM